MCNYCEYLSRGLKSYLEEAKNPNNQPLSTTIPERRIKTMIFHSNIRGDVRVKIGGMAIIKLADTKRNIIAEEIFLAVPDDFLTFE